MQSKFFYSLAIVIFLAGEFLFLGNVTRAETTTHLVISQIKIAGETAKDEFIEIYNPTEEPIDLSGWSLQYKSATGSKFYKKNFPSESSIGAHGWFLIAHNDYTGETLPDMHQASFSLAGNGGNIFLVNNQNTLTSPTDESIVDKVAYGTGDAPEDTAAPAPPSGQSIERKPGNDLGNSEDSDNNFFDFTFQETPTPRNSTSSPKPDLALTPEAVCGNGICEEEEDEIICPADCETPLPEESVEPEVGQVVINELVSDPELDNEWIELYNKSAININLDGCSLEDGVGIIATLSEEITSSKFKVIELSSNKLNNSGDIIYLKKSDGTIIDQVSYGDWDDGALFDNAPKASDPNSLARITDGEDSNIDIDDFTITTTLTKGSSNIILEPEELASSDEKRSLPPSSPPSPLSWPVGSILINEFVSDPGDKEDEWIELFNSAQNAINLEGWTIEDGTEIITKLSGSILSSNFFVIEKPKGILNNDGDIILLKDPAGITIDKVTYGNWNDGDKSDNAPKASDPNSISRKNDGQDTNNDFNDFSESVPTKGTSNIEKNSPDKRFEKFIGSIVINEIFPNPEGSDRADEFIEIKNIGNENIDLENWLISDNSNKNYSITSSDFENTIIGVNEFLVLYRKNTKIALNNTGTESVQIFSPDNTPIDSIEYSGPSGENESWAKQDKKWTWSTTPTPAAENIITKRNKKPTAVIYSPLETFVNQEIVFDGSDSYDEDGEVTSFFWNFGDGSTQSGLTAKHTYNKTGAFTIILTIKDNGNEVGSAETIIDVLNKQPDRPTAGNANSINKNLIVINEAIPNPLGSDEEEWIELLNLSNNNVDLSLWQIDDGEGGSKPHTISKGTTLNKNSFLIFSRRETKIALNNTSDSVRLIDPSGEVIFETTYNEVFENSSWARDKDGAWYWTKTLTPLAKNIINFTEKKSVITKKSSSKKANSFTRASLEDIKDHDLGDKVIAQGQVVVLPGILGSQFFYITNEDGCPGLQVYMYKKNFPELSLGDLIEVRGSLSQSGGERRIKISTKEDIRIIKKRDPILPQPIEISEVEEALEGCLVTISADITEKNGKNIYLDDETGELKAYLKTIPQNNFNISDKVGATGIISKTKTGYRILPRSKEDITIITKSKNEELNNIMALEDEQTEKINLFLGLATSIFGLTTLGLSIKSGIFSNWWKKIKGI